MIGWCVVNGGGGDGDGWQHGTHIHTHIGTIHKLNCYFELNTTHNDGITKHYC